MGHSISALVCKPSAGIERLVDYDLTHIPVGNFVIVPLDAYHSDSWTERLGLGFRSGKTKIILDNSLVHHIAEFAATDEYAIIETDCFGGVGDQIAAVYRSGQESPLWASERVSAGAINHALRMIGVKKRFGKDEFNTLGLGNYRRFDEYFEDYWD
ncbi:MAG: hypothetical protein RH917_10215 [Lacipirellulaceae bacterium]